MQRRLDLLAVLDLLWRVDLLAGLALRDCLLAAGAAAWLLMLLDYIVH